MIVATENRTAATVSTASVPAVAGHRLARDEITGTVRVRPSSVQFAGRHRRASRFFGRR
ncbi:hypothetical protein QM716_28320 [Rhodococcus sp. IEGM 1409]|uniref:hypothetical protein n=1 Tax=Rhodococcus sp. IEGM 1409 TaxID=3047082 RepID=UPI0024B6EE26|nr:hypothetical protein [Rhodococcus sp. IEGM 1409]MDI9903775.1 hypothetical protein [Rhodococcus sp. IEGM 1409]